MRKAWAFVAPLLLSGYALLAPLEVAKACNAPEISPRATVGTADVIVRATAAEVVANQGIVFKVTEVLKGEGVPPTLIVEGSLSKRDEFNKGSVPYGHVRSSGSASCFAREYKEGAEFLLILKKQKGRLTPYWYPLAPTNEQLRSESDPWLIWVKAHLNWLASASQVEKLEHVFELIKREGWDVEAGLLWEYRFVDADAEKLRRLAKHLQTLGFRDTEISPSNDEEDEPASFTLRVEKVEKLSPATMAERDQNFRDLAARFDVKAYKGWVVSKVN